MLYANQMEEIVANYLTGKSSWQEKKIAIFLDSGNEIPLELSYFFNKEKNTVVIPAPLAVQRLSTMESFEPSYKEVIDSVIKNLNYSGFSIIASLLGKGTGERHYGAIFQDEKGEMVFFDSKLSNSEQFFSSAEQPTRMEKGWGYLTTPFKTLVQYIGHYSNNILGQFLDHEIEIYQLGTQSIFDGVSCGYHSTGAVIAMIDKIDESALVSKNDMINLISHTQDLDQITDYLIATVTESDIGSDSTVEMFNTFKEHNSFYPINPEQIVEENTLTIFNKTIPIDEEYFGVNASPVP